MPKDLIKCPRCQGSGWDPDGGECQVCHGARVICASNAVPASYDDADRFFDEVYNRRIAYKV
jgi:hypothetical protein